MGDDYFFQKAENHKPYNVESWYPILRAHTAKSVFLPLNVNEAKAIVAYYQLRFNKKEGYNYEAQNKLHELEQRIKHAISDFSDFFLRLSTRSPKDGMPLNSNNLQQQTDHIYQQLISKYATSPTFPLIITNNDNNNVNVNNNNDNKNGKNEEENEDKKENDGKDDEKEGKGTMEKLCAANLRLIAISSAQMNIVKLQNEKEAMNIILSSERVFSDLILALSALCYVHPFNYNAYLQTYKDYYVAPQEWYMNIILREWNDRIIDQLEFRLFIKEGYLICISQYNHYCVFPQLLPFKIDGSDDDHEVRLARHGKLKHALISFWQQIHSLLIAEDGEYVDDIKGVDGVMAERTKFREMYKQGYVLDLAIFSKSSIPINKWDAKIYEDDLDFTVIELNPFETSTGACLFTWPQIYRKFEEKVDQQEIELRIRGEVMENLDDLVDGIILPAVNETVPPYYHFYLPPPQNNNNNFFSSLFSKLRFGN